MQVSANRRNQHDFVLGRQRVSGMDNVIDNPGFEAGGRAGKPGIGLGYEPFAPGEYREDFSFVSAARPTPVGSPRRSACTRGKQYSARSPATTRPSRVRRGWPSLGSVLTDRTRRPPPDQFGGHQERRSGHHPVAEPPTRAGPQQRLGLAADRTHRPAGNRVPSLNLHAAGKSGSAYFDDLCLGMPKPN